jgi:hypothetical protein
VFSFGERLAESGFDDLRRPVVAVTEQVPIHVESNGGGGMAQPPADGNRVHAGSNELARMRVPEGMQTDCRQLEFRQSAHPFPRCGVGASHRAVPARKNEITLNGSALP